jgi:hypothetical protein
MALPLGDAGIVAQEPCRCRDPGHKSKTNPNNTQRDNCGTSGNYNPNTGHDWDADATALRFHIVI